jgi:hypothetical protein
MATMLLQLKEQQQQGDERTIPHASMNLPESLSTFSASVWPYAHQANRSFSQGRPVRSPEIGGITIGAHGASSHAFTLSPDITIRNGYAEGDAGARVGPVPRFFQGQGG